MKKRTTGRGFDIYLFKDKYKNQCSLQKSSLATSDCIWLGVDENRMHLTKTQVKKLLPILKLFAETGEIS